MKRTTIYFEPELDVLLKLEGLRQKRPMADIVREAVHAYVTRQRRAAPPGAGAFASGHSDTAERVDEVLAETGFGGSSHAKPSEPNLPRKTARKRTR